MDQQREQLLQQLWEAQNQAYALMSEYVSLPHHYGDNILYQAEGHLIDLIAVYPGVTITDLASILKKTTSACSQMVRKLKNKGWVEQVRNQENNRQLNLSLTEAGMQIYEDHQRFIRACQQSTFHQLEHFTTEQLEHHLQVQQLLNQAYQGDVHRSRDRFISQD